jgi:RNA polymerase primary sigma factor
MPGDTEVLELEDKLEEGNRLLGVDEQEELRYDRTPGLVEAEHAEHDEDLEVPAAAARTEFTEDPVRVYLREAGAARLLTREKEVVIAKRIERGQGRVLRVVSRSPLVWSDLLAAAEDLRGHRRSVRDLVQFDEEEITEKKLEKKTQQTLRVLDRIAEHHAVVQKLAAQLSRIPKSNTARRRVARSRFARQIVETSRLVRSLEFTSSE